MDGKLAVASHPEKYFSMPYRQHHWRPRNKNGTMYKHIAENGCKMDLKEKYITPTPRTTKNIIPISIRVPLNWAFRNVHLYNWFRHGEVCSKIEKAHVMTCSCKVEAAVCSVNMFTANKVVMKGACSTLPDNYICRLLWSGSKWKLSVDCTISNNLLSRMMKSLLKPAICNWAFWQRNLAACEAVVILLRLCLTFEGVHMIPPPQMESWHSNLPIFLSEVLYGKYQHLMLQIRMSAAPLSLKLEAPPCKETCSISTYRTEDLQQKFQNSAGSAYVNRIWNLTKFCTTAIPRRFNTGPSCKGK